ncbi:hypothetical protein P3T27_004474 [Kitasatospora sp. MAA19]|nr:hypothetical protein [Kitasatospora sp. MAA19]
MTSALVRCLLKRWALPAPESQPAALRWTLRQGEG